MEGISDGVQRCLLNCPAVIVPAGTRSYAGVQARIMNIGVLP